ncbi:hypothetical protein [Anoxybacillus flavithermus]|uniref:hypothetical protein n=1 Tax=Anoxybacillus flavithermus TaxID=33934 RepID=UPI0018690BC6|nr:hypothetical protein [Anoxybacillus flavithermus]MBE2930799.1 hypothetical protein [Anoxybacillus flavithermus]MBE2957821.1 hypothetical protein [Anoxybacillus flavithermus]
MAEITANGYVSIREHIVQNWKKVVLKDASNAQIFTTNIDGVKAKWTHTRTTEQRVTGWNDFGEPMYEQVKVESIPTLEISIKITGADVSPLPSSVSKVQVIDSQNRIMTEETFAPFTFKTAQDELTLSVKIQVPQQ